MFEEHWSLFSGCLRVEKMYYMTVAHLVSLEYNRYLKSTGLSSVDVEEWRRCMPVAHLFLLSTIDVLRTLVFVQ